MDDAGAEAAPLPGGEASDSEYWEEAGPPRVQTGSEAGTRSDSCLSSPEQHADKMSQTQYTEVKVRGYKEFIQALARFPEQLVFALFCGSKNETGASWCPDCVKAEPIVQENLQYLPEESIFIYCDVGEREYWKNPSNEFKQNLKLTGVPTLLKCGTPQKLVEEECFKSALVQMLFTDD
uniref:Thioredoxin domain-containing protein 17 n=1 Tax=Geotrypetes seraphini TaxID=260995 RepID=A0A6P8PAG6_GEOSA|nr:thioredoxin domain-containing protein 17 [Geotrypetes seraphini]